MEEEILKLVGARIKDIRKSRNLSQEALGEKAGFSYSYLGSIERGKKNISLINLSKIAKALDESLPTTQAEGTAVARMNNKQLGRPRVEITEDFEKAYRQWKDGRITAVKAMELSKLTKPTFYRLVKEYESKIG